MIHFPVGRLALVKDMLPAALLTGMACIALVGCASAPDRPGASVVDGIAVRQTTELGSTYAALLTPGGSVFQLSPTNSVVRIYAFRAGKAAAFGHNHVLSTPEFLGFFYLAADGTAASRFDLEFRLDQLAFDDPKHRSTLGAAFASTITAEATASTRDNLLGDNNFQAARFPWVRIRSIQIVGEAPKFAAKVAVELHGQTREMWTALTVKGLPDHLTVDGALVLRQSDFGVKPLSVLGGLLAVQDEVIVEFKLAGEKHGF